MQAPLIQLTHHQIKEHTLIFILMVAVLFLGALLGIYTRPLAYSAFFWPANPIFLGLLIRYPKLRNSSALLGAFVGYMLADLLTGNAFALTIILTLTNFITVIVTLTCLLYFQNQFKAFKDGALIIYPYIFAVLVGTFCCSLFAVNTIPYVPHTFMSTEQLFVDFATWWSGEILNAVVMLPLILSFPKKIDIINFFRDRRDYFINIIDIIPFLAVLFSIVLAHTYYGPGALLYPLATLIWATSVYSLFSIAIINSLVCLTLYHSMSFLYLNDSTNSFLTNILSVRLGLSILGIATITLCLISLIRKALFKDVYYLANHDTLTNTMNRRSFIRVSEKILTDRKIQSATFLMLDIDHFKKLNDTYGHHAGDIVLQKFSEIVKDNLRENDLFCRHGGEEFIIMLSNTSDEDAQVIAERIRKNLADTPISVPQHNPIYITVSIGLHHFELPTGLDLQQLINFADKALYVAKANGRNQVVTL